MARRALRRLDRATDLSRHLFAAEELPRPLEASVFFGREAPLEVEVGSGKGLFLLNAALRRPERDFLGIEIAPKYAAFAAARLARRQLPNAKVVSGDAQQVFSECLGEGSVAAVHVYFPDPWWKARHKRRRVMNARFVGQVERVLRPGGTLHFWTDVEEYFRTTLELLAEHSRLEGPCDVPQRPAEHDMDYRTNYERRTRLKGERVYRAQFRASGKQT